MEKTHRVVRGPMFRSRAFSVLKTLVLCHALAGCSRRAEPIVLAAVGAWHLPDAIPTRRGIELAVEEVNSRGGIHGRPLSVVFWNDSTEGVRAVAIARELVADKRIIGVIGNLNSGAMLAAAKVYDGYLPAVSPTAVSAELDGISSWVFRLMPSDSLFTATLAAYAGRLGTRAGIIHDNNSFGRGAADVFQRNYSGRVIGVDPILPGSKVVEPHVTFFRRSGADLLFVAGGDVLGLAVAEEARRQDFRGAILGTDTWAFIDDLSPAEGAYVAMRFSINDRRPEVAHFATRFRERFGSNLPENGFPAFAYDATRLLAAALLREGPSRTGVRNYLASLRGSSSIPGVTGPISFLPSGGPATRGFLMMRVTKGALLPFEVPRR